MSISRLIIGLVWLLLSVLTWRGRRRLRNDRHTARVRRGLLPTLLGIFSLLYLLLGLLWLDLAF